jgi:hypothetical protein
MGRSTHTLTHTHTHTLSLSERNKTLSLTHTHTHTHTHLPPLCLQVVYQGPCTSLRRNKTLVDSVAPGSECGVVLGKGEFAAYQPGDILECVRVVTKKQDSAAGAGTEQQSSPPS